MIKVVAFCLAMVAISQAASLQSPKMDMQALILSLKPPRPQSVDYRYLCCNDDVPNIVPCISFDQACSAHGGGECRMYINGTIGCHCDRCHYGQFCEYEYSQYQVSGCRGIMPVTINTPPPVTECPECPHPGPVTCNSFVENFIPRTTYNQACRPYGECIEPNGEVRCLCDTCHEGPFCELLKPECDAPHPTTTCPPNEIVEPCCDDIALYGASGQPITFTQACEVDVRNPHGECYVQADERHCRCNPCWTGDFCEEPVIPAPPGCPQDVCPAHALHCGSKVPGLVPGITFNLACQVDPSAPHGYCLENGPDDLSCVCEGCWSGKFCEFYDESKGPQCRHETPPPGECTTAPPEVLSCSSSVPSLFPPQSYEQACQVDPLNPHGRCEPEPNGEGLHCVCNQCWTGTFCEEHDPACDTPCPLATPPPPTCASQLAGWHNGRTYNQECGSDDGRGECEDNGGVLSCKCKDCYSGDFCESFSCIRRCAYEGKRPAFYHDPPSPYLDPQPVGKSDLPEDLLECPAGFECSPDDKNCFFDRQKCFNNIGWCLPTKAEVESPAHPEDNNHV